MPEYTKELFNKLPSGRRREIMDAILSEIAEKTLRGATVRGIAKKLGLSHGSLFHYFPSKDAMVNELISSGTMAQAELFSFKDHQESSSIDKLMIIADFSLRFASEQPALIAFWLELSLPSNELYSDWNLKGELNAINVIRSIIKTGMDTGEFCAELDLDSAAFIVDSMMAALLKSSVSIQEEKKFSEHFNRDSKSLDDILSSLKNTLIRLLAN